MTENADVEWLRANSHDGIEWVVAEVALARRLLAHIEKLEADLREARSRLDAAGNVINLQEAEMARVCARTEEPDRRPTVHEIAVQIAAGIASAPWSGDMIDKEIARSAYDAAEALVAEALVAEGRRRDER